MIFHVALYLRPLVCIFVQFNVVNWGPLFLQALSSTWIYLCNAVPRSRELCEHIITKVCTSVVPSCIAYLCNGAVLGITSVSSMRSRCWSLAEPITDQQHQGRRRLCTWQLAAAQVSAHLGISWHMVHHGGAVSTSLMLMVSKVGWWT